MAVIDTSFLVALHNPTDRFHEAARQTNTAGKRRLVPWEIWLETCQILEWRTRPEHLRELLEDATRNLEIRSLVDEDDLIAIAAGLRPINVQLRGAGKKVLSLFDAIVLHVAARLREEILTFDESILEASRFPEFRGARIG